MFSCQLRFIIYTCKIFFYYSHYHMQKSNMKVQHQKLLHHPLYNDQEFVPSDIRILLAKDHKLLQSQQQQNKIVIPIQNEEVTLVEISHILQSKIKSNVKMNDPNNFSQQIKKQKHKDCLQKQKQIIDPNEEAPLYKIDLPLQSKIHSNGKAGNSKNVQQIYKQNQKGLKAQKEKQDISLKQLKHKYGKKAETIQQFKFGPKDNIPAILQSSNFQLYEICLIKVQHPTDILYVTFEWNTMAQIQQRLIFQINHCYGSSMSKKDIEFSKLNIQGVLQKQHCSLSYKKDRIQTSQKLRELVFHQSQPVYVGFDITNPALKHKQLKKKQLNEYDINSTNNAQKPLKNQKSGSMKEQVEVIKQKQRFIVLKFQDMVGMRLDFNEVRQYKIKFLLGILKVSDYDHKGIKVLSKIYKPNDYIKDFQYVFNIGADINFAYARIATERELFYSIINPQHQIESVKELKKMFKIYQSQKQDCICLEAYLNQVKYAKDNNQNPQLVTVVVKNLILNYFSQRQPFEMGAWRRYIRTLVSEIEQCQIYSGQVFRMVDYEYNNNVGEEITFKNFLVTSKNLKKAGSMCRGLKDKENISTLFKIKSICGRYIKKMNAFDLQEVMFIPFTSFLITKKTRKQNIIEIQMAQIREVKLLNYGNIVISVDDKIEEGKIIFKALKQIQIVYPVYMMQATSTQSLKKLIQDNKSLFYDAQIRKILVTNMTRKQLGVLNQIAGIQTYKFAKDKLVGTMNQILFYIGNVAGTRNKLQKQGIDPNTCQIYNQFKSLFQKLIQLCNWNDVHKPLKVHPPPPPAPDIPAKPKVWGNMFSVVHFD